MERRYQAVHAKLSMVQSFRLIWQLSTTDRFLGALSGMAELLVAHTPQTMTFPSPPPLTHSLLVLQNATADTISFLLFDCAAGFLP